MYVGSALVYRLYEPGTHVFTQSPELRRSLYLVSYCAVILKFLSIFEQGPHIFILYKTLKMMHPVLILNKINTVPAVMIR